MVNFKCSALACLGALATLSAVSPAQAGPDIKATNVSPICKVESDGTVSTVAVTLDSTTAAFYNTGLSYHFLTANGTPVSFASPSSVPPRFAVPAGTYTLVMSTSLTYPNPNASTSSGYLVTVPAPQVLTFRNGRKICAVVRTRDAVKTDAIKQM